MPTSSIWNGDVRLYSNRRQTQVGSYSSNTTPTSSFSPALPVNKHTQARHQSPPNNNLLLLFTRTPRLRRGGGGGTRLFGGDRRPLDFDVKVSSNHCTM